MDKVLKLFLNQFKCPICKAPIDMLPSGVIRNYSYGCANDYDHYVIGFTNDFAPILTSEIVNVYDGKHKYAIYKLHQNGKVKTEIRIYDTDPEGRVIFSFKEKKVVTDLDAFDFNTFTVEKAVKRIKTILVFQ